MVAARAMDEITDPSVVIHRIYSDSRDVRRLPSAVSEHFARVLFSPGALEQLPSVDVFHPPESYTPGTLVRFRAMVQDTSLQNEVYLAKFTHDLCGGWGMPPPHDDYDVSVIDPDHLGTAAVLWAVSVPAESPWRTAEISQPESTSFPAHHPALPHKFPIPRAHHVGVRVKIYDTTHVEKLHSTDIVTFVGIAASESLSADDDSSPQVPVLHVLCYQPLTDTPITDIDHTVRTDLIDWVSNEALGGDSDAAEWILLQFASIVHVRAMPLLPPSLTLSRFPRPSSPELPPALSHILAELLPQYVLIPLSLDLLNKFPFLPESKEEDLHSGYLQLPHGTTILLTESAVEEGKLLERGITNIQAVQDVLNSQSVDYIFPFSCKFTFNTDLSVIVLSEGRKSAFFKTGINLPLRCSPADHGLYKPKDEISFPPPEKMALFRSYIAACKTLSKKVHVTEETSKRVQDDFVRLRQQDKSMTQDELIHLMKVARLLAASRLQDEVTTDIWEKAKELDERRRTR